MYGANIHTFFSYFCHIDIVYSKKNDVLCGKCNDNVLPKK